MIKGTGLFEALIQLQLGLAEELAREVRVYEPEIRMIRKIERVSAEL